MTDEAAMRLALDEARAAAARGGARTRDRK